jgi:hypothetical protein
VLDRRPGRSQHRAKGAVIYTFVRRGDGQKLEANVFAVEISRIVKKASGLNVVLSVVSRSGDPTEVSQKRNREAVSATPWRAAGRPQLSGSDLSKASKW